VFPRDDEDVLGTADQFNRLLLGIKRHVEWGDYHFRIFSGKVLLYGLFAIMSIG
jgi:hypothetical protein